MIPPRYSLLLALVLAFMAIHYFFDLSNAPSPVATAEKQTTKVKNDVVSSNTFPKPGPEDPGNSAPAKSAQKTTPGYFEGTSVLQSCPLYFNRDDIEEHKKSLSIHDSATCSAEAQPRKKLLLTFALPRTGSTLLLSAYDAIHKSTDRCTLDHVGFGELLKFNRRNHLLNALSETACQLTPASGDGKRIIASHSKSVEGWHKKLRSVSKDESNEALVHFLDDTTSWGIRGLATYLRFASNHTEAWQCDEFLSYLKRIPTYSDNGYVSMKIFQHHIEQYLETTMAGFFKTIERVWEPESIKVVVLYRRKAIESFVSGQIASSKSLFYKRQSTEDDAIKVKQTKFRKYLQMWSEYYQSIHSTLTSMGVPYELVEYENDLQEPEMFDRTRRRMIEVLGLRSDQVDNKFLSRGPKLKKQAQVPVHAQVTNWNDVVGWGLPLEVADWDALMSLNITAIPVQQEK